jgi:hypothetical protein
VSDLDDLVRRGVIEVVETGQSVPDEGARAATPESEEPLGAGEVARALAANPVSVTAARAQPLAGGAPASPGFYAWWAAEGAIAGAPHHPHPARAELGLLYVGISPARDSSAGTIRSRVVGQHVGGNTSSSTFRFVLAALLLEELALTPRGTGSKVVLDYDDNARLRDWQLEQLSLTWCERERPWEVESEVIARMQPPLNSAGNRDHPFHARVASARAAFRAAARR